MVAPLRSSPVVPRWWSLCSCTKWSNSSSISEPSSANGCCADPPCGSKPVFRCLNAFPQQKISLPQTKGGKGHRPAASQTPAPPSGGARHAQLPANRRCPAPRRPPLAGRLPANLARFPRLSPVHPLPPQPRNRHRRVGVGRLAGASDK